MRLCGFEVGLFKPMFLIAGPCVVESEALALSSAQALKDIAERLGIPLIYKSSFDKANRSSHRSFRGLGVDEGLRILEKVRLEVGLPVLTDVHEDTPLDQVADVVSVLQTPAFLCRQTNFIQRVAARMKPVNIKKGQFLAPADMAQVVAKARAVGNEQIMVCERGASFGYNNLVSDMRSLAIMRATGCPVVFDATHSAQLPGGLGETSGGQRQMIPVLARAAVATGIAGLFMETHPNPDQAKSDGPNSWPLHLMPTLLTELKALDEVVKSYAFLEEPSAGEREGCTPRKKEPSAGEREGCTPRKKEPSAGEREGAPLAKKSSAGEREGCTPRKKEPSAGEREGPPPAGKASAEKREGTPIATQQPSVTKHTDQLPAKRSATEAAAHHQGTPTAARAGTSPAKRTVPKRIKGIAS